MNIVDLILSVFNVLICISGLILCILLLVDSKLNDCNTCNITSLCLLGFGWSVFLYSSIDLFELPQFLFIAGKLCFLIGLFLWFYKNILSLQFNKCFFRGENNGF